MPTYNTNLRRVTQTLTLPATPVQFAIGDVLGSTAAPKSNIVFDVTDRDYAGQAVWVVGATLSIALTAVPVDMTAGFSLHLFRSTTVQQDSNAAWALAIGDIDTYVSSIDLPLPVDRGVFLWSENYDLNIPFTYDTTSPTIIAQLVTKSAFTPLVSDVYKVSLILAKA